MNGFLRCYDFLFLPRFFNLSEGSVVVFSNRYSANRFCLYEPIAFFLWVTWLTAYKSCFSSFSVTMMKWFYVG
jgi:hypothetical protein